MTRGEEVTGYFPSLAVFSCLILVSLVSLHSSSYIRSRPSVMNEDRTNRERPRRVGRKVGGM